MNPSRAILLSLMATLCGAMIPAVAEEFPIFVGERVCLECHGPASHYGAAGTCRLPSVDAHRPATTLLKRSRATSIAAISGIAESPQRSRICLDCHGTAADEGPRWTAVSFDPTLGVQCEACHGAGSLHVAAVRADDSGGQPSRTATQIRSGSGVRCHGCHAERPSHAYVVDRGFRIRPEDTAYKTPVGLALSADGERILVACENANTLVVLDSASGEVVAEIAVGARPHGVVLSADQERVFVSNRMDNSVSVIDANTFQVVKTAPVGHQPHAIVADAQGNHVFVLDTGENTVTVLDAETLASKHQVVAGEGPWSGVGKPDGSLIYLTNVRPQFAPFRTPTHSEITVLDGLSGIATRRLKVPDANMLQGIAYSKAHDVFLFGLMRTKHLVPATRLQQGWVITNGIGVINNRDEVVQVLLDDPNRSVPDIFDVVVSPCGRQAAIVSGGADEVLLIDIAHLLELVDEYDPVERAAWLANLMGLADRFVTHRIRVGSNPRAGVYAPDGKTLYVANALDDTISVIDLQTNTVRRTISLGGPSGVTPMRAGARLFHNAGRTYGRQFSCRSCHPDGHLNGLTFDIEPDGAGALPVDNRTLQGILDTLPFKWEGTNPSLHRQCGPRLAVFFTRVEPFTPEELEALVQYMCTIERPPNRFRDERGLTLAQRRGKAVFERTETNAGRPIPPVQQCSNCHVDAYRTDRRTHAVGTTMWFDAYTDLAEFDIFDADSLGWFGSYYYFDENTPTLHFDTPHLRNLGEQAPYLHNGAAPTLELIWTRFNMMEQHGMTADLTRQQLNDLIAYLKAQ